MRIFAIVIAIGLMLLLFGCITKQDEQPPLPPEDGATNVDTGTTNTNTGIAGMPPLPPETGNTEAPKTQSNGPPLPPE